MLNPAIVKQIRNGICAIGYFNEDIDTYRHDPANPTFRIIGTGFLISENIILTNRHILEQLDKLEDQKGVLKDRISILFVYPRINDSPNWQKTFCSIVVRIIPEREKCPDIGFIEISRANTTVDFLQCRPLDFSDLSEVYLGMPIGIFGYPTGTKLLQPNLGNTPFENEKLCRVGPVLQQGYISAGTPFEVEPNTIEFLLDIRTHNGMSGSPVFLLDSGKVIGIHYKSNKMTTSFTIALSKVDIQYWLSLLGEHKLINLL